MTADCRRKCKTSILTNKALKQRDIMLLDDTPWEPKVLAETATMLGFVLRGRIAKSEWDIGSPITEIEWTLQGKISDAALRTLVLDKALGNMLRRNKQALSLTASMPARVFRFTLPLSLLVRSFAIPLTPT